MKTCKINKLAINGITGKLTENITNNFLIGLRETNPAILEMFADRDVKPYRNLLPWSGEFAGKYITGTYYTYKLTRNEELFSYILKFIDEFLTCQDDDGYLGCYQKECRLTGAFSQNPEKNGETWDSWSHYHAMYGLTLWYTETGNEEYFDCVKKIADLFINKFYNGKMTLVSIGWSEMNLAPYHMFAKLYNITKEQKYLDFALLIEEDISNEQAGNYINHALNGLEYYQCPKPRWESMHIIMGIAEMYIATNDEKYLRVVKQIVYSILKTDIHNTGGFSTDEAAVGTPFKDGAIETCCVIAYNALVIELVKLTNDIKLIDFLELSHYNAVMGYFSPSGRWSTYNTPMQGTKMANFHHINFQCRPGSPELNCCSVNAPRGVGIISEWMLTEDDETIYINSFESTDITMENGTTVNITGNYPLDGDIKIRINSKINKNFAIRIPSWANNTSLILNNEMIDSKPNTYTYINKQLNENDIIYIKLDFTVHYQYGAEKYENKRSIYYGPILYGYDLALNKNLDFNDTSDILHDELKNIKPVISETGNFILSLSNGITLSDFYRLGYTGSEYKTWLSVI